MKRTLILGVFLLASCGNEIKYSHAVKHDNDEQRGFLKKVLVSLGIPHQEFSKSDGLWIGYENQEPELEKEIRERVSQYYFVIKVCKDLPVPKPDEPAQDQLSCKRTTKGQ